jgi:hypothetical protein
MRDNIIRDDFDTGPSGLRRRASINVFSVRASMVLTTDEWEILQAFLEDDIVGRSLAFGFPAQGVTPESPAQQWLVLMNEPPQRASVAATDLWEVTISFLVLSETI